MRSILIVDDEFGIAETVSEVLSQLGYSTLTAINGHIALGTLAQAKPDLILLDVMMPVMSGPEMLRALRADEALRGIPVVMMSAVEIGSLPDDIRPLFQAFLQKPFTLEDLLAAIAKGLPGGP